MENLLESELDVTVVEDLEQNLQETTEDCSGEEGRESPAAVNDETVTGVNRFSERVNDEINDATSHLEKTIVKAVLQAMQIIENTKVSQNSFQDILDYGKQLFCEGLGEACDMDIVNSVWPTSWDEAQTILKKEGYENPKEYYVCFCRKKARKSSGKGHVYNGKWDIMENKNQACRNCGRKGKIKYYYLGLKSKVKLWCSDMQTCQKQWLIGKRRIIGW